MNEIHNSKRASSQFKDYFWIFEVVVIAAIVPALYAGVAALNRLPMI
jgi:hypothetical protein